MGDRSVDRSMERNSHILGASPSQSGLTLASAVAQLQGQRDADRRRLALLERKVEVRLEEGQGRERWAETQGSLNGLMEDVQNLRTRVEALDARLWARTGGTGSAAIGVGGAVGGDGPSAAAVQRARELEHQLQAYEHQGRLTSASLEEAQRRQAAKLKRLEQGLEESLRRLVSAEDQLRACRPPTRGGGGSTSSLAGSFAMVADNAIEARVHSLELQQERANASLQALGARLQEGLQAVGAGGAAAAAVATAEEAQEASDRAERGLAALERRSGAQIQELAAAVASLRVKVDGQLQRLGTVAERLETAHEPAVEALRAEFAQSRAQDRHRIDSELAALRGQLQESSDAADEAIAELRHALNETCDELASLRPLEVGPRLEGLEAEVGEVVMRTSMLLTQAERGAMFAMPCAQQPQLQQQQLLRHPRGERAGLEVHPAAPPSDEPSPPPVPPPLLAAPGQPMACCHGQARPSSPGLGSSTESSARPCDEDGGLGDDDDDVSCEEVGPPPLPPTSALPLPRGCGRGFPSADPSLPAPPWNAGEPQPPALRALAGRLRAADALALRVNDLERRFLEGHAAGGAAAASLEDIGFVTERSREAYSELCSLARELSELQACLLASQLDLQVEGYPEGAPPPGQLAASALAGPGAAALAAAGGGAAGSGAAAATAEHELAVLGARINALERRLFGGAAQDGEEGLAFVEDPDGGALALEASAVPAAQLASLVTRLEPLEDAFRLLAEVLKGLSACSYEEGDTNGLAGEDLRLGDVGGLVGKGVMAEVCGELARAKEDIAYLAEQVEQRFLRVEAADEELRMAFEGLRSEVAAEELRRDLDKLRTEVTISSQVNGAPPGAAVHSALAPVRGKLDHLNEQVAELHARTSGPQTAVSSPASSASRGRAAVG